MPRIERRQPNAITSRSRRRNEARYKDQAPNSNLQRSTKDQAPPQTSDPSLVFQVWFLVIEVSLKFAV